MMSPGHVEPTLACLTGSACWQAALQKGKKDGRRRLWSASAKFEEAEVEEVGRPPSENWFLLA